ncbi:MAG: hypothetical protein HRT47_04000 [Candidatus Caenarcaniphilales bacterium]|nr:hypothetical protein [Candidatus Caenarcaniphilales bacterium]
MQSIEKTYLNTDYKDRLFKKATPVESNLKKSVNKISSGLLINNVDSDSASLSIREESFAKKQFFELLMELDEAITIVNTVISSINSVSQISLSISKLKKDYQSNSNPKYHAFLQNELNSFINNIERINQKTVFNDENLVDGSFYREIKLANKDKDIKIDFRNPENDGLEITSIDFNINKISAKGNLVSNTSLPLKGIQISDINEDDLKTINQNISRMNRSANVVKQRLLIAHKDLENKMNNEFNKENYDNVKAGLFMVDFKSKLEKQSASTILTQVSEDHSGALGLLP